MRLTIYWRVILAQSALMALVLAVSLYAYTKLDRFTRLQTSILVVDSTCIKEEKQLLRVFLLEMRNAEKFLALRQKPFFDSFVQGSADFTSGLDRIRALAVTDPEGALTGKIDKLHADYESGLKNALSDRNTWERTKSAISDEIIENINELIRLREQAVADKTALAGKESAAAASDLGWLTAVGMVAGLLLAYLHARGVSRPLNQLASEMDRVGRGDFDRAISVRAPAEVHRLTQAFNRMADELARLDRVKADFTAHVSHELRTPLTAIREGTALLLEEIQGPLAQGQRDILEVVYHHSERLFHTISSILDLSKMEAEMMEYELTPCDLSGLIWTSVEAVQVIARKKEIDLQTSLTEPLPILCLDERRIRQVLDNLLSNALKFTPEGGRVNVAASLGGDDNGGAGWVEVEVSDTGEGIAEHEAEKVFERFYQSPNGEARHQQGTGLGLAIAQHIIEAHKGRIWLKSKPGKGSTFIFALPIDGGTSEA
jgi:two-component system, NtrC family, sensor histidine kinase GlrK